ncbi:hypothetical protein [Crocosphaera chwakensis]|uniref:Elongation factor G n=1 Tax=Crocosphaera chwakensis CCY0110 TaxID=391612 RepID=A3ISG7_9CHRO|nr:hypothetical protein [Crocosphaera chwakensis]EAZ90537.1 elongation factor G [Crocosphaera chwakensis CCY0110]
MNLTLPKWLQPNVSITKQRQMTHDDSNQEKTIQVVFNQEKDVSSYLDDYIHHYF